ncbi:MAG: M23 family metallopeptidase [Candidatus Omnitrophica bacterium]|nr:M23 family metallopeptidase [Candidatus Omnitrophota bacterium]
MAARRFPIARFILLSFFSLAGAYAIILIIYFVREPHFIVPIRSENTAITVRNDAYGDGYFGAKRSNNRTHSGIDLEAPVGTPVYASKSGIGLFKKLKTGYGNLVVIYHVNGDESRYGHLSKSNIREYGWVKQGKIIGYVGKTGNAGNRNMKAHLHFEIRRYGKPVDPVLYL